MNEQIFEYEEGLEDSAELLVQKSFDDTLSFLMQKTIKYDEEFCSVEFEEINLSMNRNGVEQLRNALNAWLGMEGT